MAMTSKDDLNISFMARTAIFVISVIANFVIICLGAQWFGSANPAWMAALLTGTMVIHECGHALLMSRAGLKPLMFFAVILGGAMPTRITASKQLSWSREAAIVVAGPVANLLLIVVAWILAGLDLLSTHHASQIASVNAIVFFCNMIPVSILDGGRFTKLLFNSIPENQDLRMMRRIGIAIMAASMIIAMILRNGPYLSPFIIYLGLFHQATHDDPNGSRNRRAMTKREQVGWALGYTMLMIVGLTLYAMAKPWTE